MTAPARKERVLVMISDTYLDRFSLVVERLQRAGLEIRQSMEILGTVAGAIESEKIIELRQMAGVAHVERDREIRGLQPED